VIRFLAAVTAILFASLPARGRLSGPPHADYLLDVTILPKESRLDVSGTVRLPPTDLARDTVALVLSSWMPALSVSVSEPGGVRVAGITTDSAAGDRTWKIALRPRLPAGTPVTLAFQYRSDSVRSVQLRVTPQGSLAGGGGEIWYPRLAFDSLTTGTLRFHVPRGETVVSNGSLVKNASDSTQSHFEFRVSSGVHFGFATGPYERYTLGGKAPVALYLLRKRPNADAMLRRIVLVRRALEKQFGPMSPSSYAVAEVDFGVGGTSEFGFFLADRSNVDQGLPSPLIGHEIGHAWWGTRVMTKPGPGRTVLTEGIASFGMIRALEAVEGANAAAQFRRSLYPGSETSGSPAEYFGLAAAGIERPIASFVPRSQYDILTMHRMANTRGWFLLDMLSREVGRSRFDALLRELIAKYSGSAMSFAEFRQSVERASPRDISWFFDDWFARTGAPTYHLDWARTANGVTGTITQPAPAFRATIPLELRGASGRRQIAHVWVGDTAVSFQVRVPFVVQEVLLDPGYQVLRWTPELRRTAVARAPFLRADFERRYGSAKRAVELFRLALDSLSPAVDTSSLRFSTTYGFAVALLATGDSAHAYDAVQRAIALPARDPVTLPRAYLLLARLAHSRGDTELALRAVRDAVAADSIAGNRAGMAEVAKGLPWVPKLAP
jgi:hypothetical protein